MFTEALFTIAKICKQPFKCPSMDEWIKKMWFMCTVEHYSTIKRVHLAICGNVDEP